MKEKTEKAIDVWVSQFTWNTSNEFNMVLWYKVILAYREEYNSFSLYDLYEAEKSIKEIIVDKIKTVHYKDRDKLDDSYIKRIVNNRLEESKIIMSFIKVQTGVLGVTNALH